MSVIVKRLNLNPFTEAICFLETGSVWLECSIPLGYIAFEDMPFKDEYSDVEK